MVGDVPEVLLDVRVDQPHRTLAQQLHGPQQRRHGPLELQHLALELVDPAGIRAARCALAAARGEHLDLDLVDVVLHRVGDRDVPVDDVVGDGVQHRRGALGQQLGVVLEAVPEGAQGALSAVPDGDEEVPSGEAHDLAGLDDLAVGVELVVLDVVDGLEDREQRVVVALQLGPLVGLDGVLHGQRVQPELAGDTGEFGLGGLVQADPHEAPVAAHQAHRLVRGQRGLGLDAAAVPVDGAVDDGRGRRGAAGGVVRPTLLAQRHTGRTDDGAQVADHRHGGLLRGRATKGAGDGWNYPE